VAPWIIGGLQHVTLMLVGGATKSYSHTVRVVAYGWGSHFWLLIPCVGLLMSPIMTVISYTVGLDETHKCGIGKALIAVFGIPLLCTCCYIAFAVIVGLTNR